MGALKTEPNANGTPHLTTQEFLQVGTGTGVLQSSMCHVAQAHAYSVQ